MFDRYEDYRYWFILQPDFNIKVINKSNGSSFIVTSTDIEQKHTDVDKGISQAIISIVHDEFEEFKKHRPEARLYDLDYLGGLPVKPNHYFTVLKASYMMRSFEQYYNTRIKNSSIPTNSVTDYDDKSVQDQYHVFEQWLLKTDLSEAPFSNKHFNHRYGLVTYLYLTAVKAFKLSKIFNIDSLSKIVLCALTHRFDKIYRYNYGFDSSEFGYLTKCEVDPNFVYGRGITSIILLSRFIHLDEDEELALRWSSGAWFTNQVDYGDLSYATYKYDLVKIIQFACTMAFSNNY